MLGLLYYANNVIDYKKIGSLFSLFMNGIFIKFELLELLVLEKNNENGSISLPEIPKNKEYEDFIAAILQSGGYYLERGIIPLVSGEKFSDKVLIIKHQ